MNELSTEDVFELARAAGIELDDQRASAIAVRLSGVLKELEMIPDDAVAELEPLLTFVVEEAQHEQP